MRLDRSSKTLEASSRVKDGQRFPSFELHLSSMDRRHRTRRSTLRLEIDPSALSRLSSRSNSTSSGSSRCGYSTRDANRRFGQVARHSPRSFLDEDHRSVHQMYSLGARELCLLVAISSVDLRDETVDRMRERIIRSVGESHEGLSTLLTDLRSIHDKTSARRRAHPLAQLNLAPNSTKWKPIDDALRRSKVRVIPASEISFDRLGFQSTSNTLGEGGFKRVVSAVVNGKP